MWAVIFAGIRYRIITGIMIITVVIVATGGETAEVAEITGTGIRPELRLFRQKILPGLIEG
jgi:hypothetical protein